MTFSHGGSTKLSSDRRISPTSGFNTSNDRPIISRIILYIWYDLCYTSQLLSAFFPPSHCKKRTYIHLHTCAHTLPVCKRVRVKQLFSLFYKHERCNIFLPASLFELSSLSPEEKRKEKKSSEICQSLSQELSFRTKCDQIVPTFPRGCVSSAYTFPGEMTPMNATSTLAQ